MDFVTQIATSSKVWPQSWSHELGPDIMSRQISQLIDKAIELTDTGISMSKVDKNRLDYY